MRSMKHRRQRYCKMTAHYQVYCSFFSFRTGSWIQNTLCERIFSFQVLNLDEICHSFLVIKKALREKHRGKKAPQLLWQVTLVFFSKTVEALLNFMSKHQTTFHRKWCQPTGTDVLGTSGVSHILLNFWKTIILLMRF